MLHKRSALLLLATALLGASAGWTYYRVSATGAGMTDAARAFLKALSDEQKQVAVMDYAAPQRLDWHFIPKDERKGLQIKQMTEEQRTAAHALLKSALSEVGYGKSTKIMEYERLLNEFEEGRGRFARDPQRYYVTIFGTPEADARWGLSFEGHHLSLNFVVDKGEVISSTPQVFAANPAVIKNENKTGIPVGAQLLKKEEELAFQLVNALEGEAQSTAIIAAEPLKEIRDAASPQPPSDPPVGLPSARMNDDQRKLLKSLIAEYASAMPMEVMQTRLKAIDEAGFDGVHFAWAGATEPGIGHYYRIQGPTFLIEFVNTQPDAAGNLANHIHSIWRDMRGDFAIPVASE